MQPWRGVACNAREPASGSREFEDEDEFEDENDLLTPTSLR